MNHIYSVLWNAALGRFCVTSEIGRSRSRATTQRRAASSMLRPGLTVLAALVAMAWAAPTWSQGLPQGHQLASGQAQVTSAGQQMHVTQSTPKAILNWQSFNIGAGHTVTFAQPNASSVVLNRVIGADASAIHGKLEANGQVFLVNPNGVLFGTGAQIDVGGLVASTLDISNQDFLKGRYQFTGLGSKVKGAEVINQGTITATDGGAVALLGGQVSNQGTIVARLGSVALAAGNQVTLDFAGDKLLNVRVDEGALNALAENHELIKADGGLVLMTAKATDALLQTVVNNTGRILARSVENRQGRIVLRGGLDEGSVLVSGKLDASAATGDGGLVETRGARVKILAGTQVTTAAPEGKTGVWHIASASDLTVSADGDIEADTLTNNLAHTSITLQSTGTEADQGDIHINAPVAWDKNRLTLSADRNLHINTTMTASGTGALSMNHGGDPSGSGVQMALSDSGFTGRVDFTGPDAADASTHRLEINGQGYKLLTSMQAIQDMDLDGHYALAHDIDAKDFKKTDHWFSSQGQDFKPIGPSPDKPFTGQLQGLGHKISDLRIARQNEPHVGLFGVVSGGLSNLGMEGGSVQGRTRDVAVIETGAFASRMVGASMRNVYTTAKVTGQAELGVFGSTPLMAITGGAVGHVQQSHIDNVRVNADVRGRAEGKSPKDAYSAVGGAFGLVQGGSIGQVDVQGSVTGEAKIRPAISQVFYPRVLKSYAADRGMGISYAGGAIGDLHGGDVHGITAKNSVQEGTYVPAGSSARAYKGTSFVSSHAEVGNSPQAEKREINADLLNQHSPTLLAIAYRSLSKHNEGNAVNQHGEQYKNSTANSTGNSTDTSGIANYGDSGVAAGRTVSNPAVLYPHFVEPTTDAGAKPPTTGGSQVQQPGATTDKVTNEDPTANPGAEKTAEGHAANNPAVLYPHFVEPTTDAGAKPPTEGGSQVLQPGAPTATLTDKAPKAKPVDEKTAQAHAANSPAGLYPHFVEPTTDAGAKPPTEGGSQVLQPGTPADSVADTATDKALKANSVDVLTVTNDQHTDSPVTRVVAETASPAQATADDHVVTPTPPRLADMAPLPTPAPAASVDHAETSPRSPVPPSPVEQERLLRNPAYVSATASAASTATERIAPQPAVAPASQDAPYRVIGTAIRLPAR